MSETLLRMAHMSVMQYLRDWANGSGLCADHWDPHRHLGPVGRGQGNKQLHSHGADGAPGAHRVDVCPPQKRAKLCKLKKRSLLYRANATPTCNWTAANKSVKHQYAAFLSHNKQDAAQTARYMHGQLQLMLGEDVFLDSVDLLDFRDLFSFHLDKSATLVCLASPLFFHSSWCPPRNL